MRHIFTLTLLFVLTTYQTHAQFTNVAAATGTNVGGTKDGGAAWGDLNNDGCLDLMVNTTDNTIRTRLYLSNCALPDPTFTDITATHAAGFLARSTERQVLWGDLNNDGYVDVVRTDYQYVEVYLNKGPLATPAYSLGNATQGPNFFLQTGVAALCVGWGGSFEGVSTVDYNNDGWLDLLVDFNENGVLVFRNPGDGTANFVRLPCGSLGLPGEGSSNDGDYTTATDINQDGYVDFIDRKGNATTNPPDVWMNNGDGTFGATSGLPNFRAWDNDKGGTIFGDFDNDGDFDFIWTDGQDVAGARVNVIYQQTAPGVWTQTNEPWASAGIARDVNGIDGIASGDLDNDGDLDLVMGDANGVYVFYNNNPGSLSFTRNNNGITTNTNTEGLTLADYDNDGDLDVYINMQNGANQLWENSTNNNNYAKIYVKKTVPANPSLGTPEMDRTDLGALVTLHRCDGTLVGGVRDLNAGKGHGDQDPQFIHFGLPAIGPGIGYFFRIRFTATGNAGDPGTHRTVIDIPFLSDTPNKNLIVATEDTIAPPCEVILPTTNLTLSGTLGEENTAKLVWTADAEINCDYYELQRAIVAEQLEWETINTQEAFGNTISKHDYNYDDPNLLASTYYYRVKQVDLDASSDYSNTVTLTVNIDQTNVGAAVPVLKPGQATPNPNDGLFSLPISLVQSEKVNVMLYNDIGQSVWLNSYELAAGDHALQIEVTLPQGIYMLVTDTASERYEQKLVIW